MLESLFSSPVSLQRFYCSALEQHLRAFAAEGAAVGYANSSLRPQLYLLTDLAEWLAQHDMSAIDLDENVMDRFCATGRRIRRSDRATLRRFLDYLRKEGIAALLPVSFVVDPVKQLLNTYSSYLSDEQCLTLRAFANYGPFIERFLREYGTNVGMMTASNVHSFVLTLAPTMARKRCQLMTTALKSFFRFLLQKGLSSIDLAAAVPSVANWRQVSVPKYLSTVQIDHLIRTCLAKRSRRDFAILLLLARLGLRACEVVRMELNDIDWRTGELLVRGKGQVHERLPLPHDVGKALSHYLRFERPPSPTRRVFIRSRAPYLGFANSIAVCTIVMRLMKQAGIDTTKGLSSHIFRHSLATAMLRNGGSLGEIGDVLRHKSQNTTEIYAKVDTVGLRSLAQPWPASEVQL